MTFGLTRWRRLTVPEEALVRTAYRLQGVGVGELATRYGVSKQTIYRTLKRAPRGISTVEVAEWQAPFEITDEGPVQVGPWVPR